MEYVKLNNGVNMPVIGLGTYMISPKDAETTTRESLKMGYRMVDTAKVQIILRWHIDMGFIVIPGTSKVDHARENFDILDFKLTDEDMQKIAKVNKNERYYIRTEEALQQFAMWQPEYEKE